MPTAHGAARPARRRCVLMMNSVEPTRSAARDHVVPALGVHEHLDAGDRARAPRRTDVGGEPAVHRAVARARAPCAPRRSSLGVEPAAGLVRVVDHAVVQRQAQLAAPRCCGRGAGRAGTARARPWSNAQRSARSALDDVHTVPPCRPVNALIAAVEFMYVTGTVPSAASRVGQHVPGVLDLADRRPCRPSSSRRRGRAARPAGRRRGQDVRALGHEVHAAEDDVRGVRSRRRVAGELERVAGDVGERDDLVALVVMAEDEHRSPSAALAARARSTRSGSDGAGRSPGHSTPRSESGSAPRPSRSSASGVGRRASRRSAPHAVTAGRLGSRRPRSVTAIVRWRAVHVSWSPPTASPARSRPSRPRRRSPPAGGGTTRARLDLAPLSDGGPGFVEVLAASVPGELHEVRVERAAGRHGPGAGAADGGRHGVRRVCPGLRARPAAAARSPAAGGDDGRCRRAAACGARPARAHEGRRRGRRHGDDRRRSRGAVRGVRRPAAMAAAGPAASSRPTSTVSLPGTDWRPAAASVGRG